LNVQFLLPDPLQLHLDGIEIENNSLQLIISPISLFAVCPNCSQESVRVHSGYTRKPADLPCSGWRVQLQIYVRRFFCDNSVCLRRTFVEQMHELIDAYARRTKRLIQAQRDIAYSDGGEAGARLTTKLGMPTSPDTLLRMIQSTMEREKPCPRVLGVDDWAIHKRHTYGTILVDLERREVVDLLPDRKPETLARWLINHPQVEIISRDRGDEYIQGIAQGAPHAIQIADRFHLLQNLLDVVERLLKHHPNDLRQAAAKCALTSEAEPTPEQPALIENQGEPPPREQPQKSYREMRFEEVKALQAEGCSQREIERRLGISRRTVAKYFRLEVPPSITRQNSSGSKMLPYLDFVQKRWVEGCYNLTQLFAELQAQGFSGSYASLYRAVHGRLGVGNLKTAKGLAPKPVVFSPRQAAWALIRPESSLREQQISFRNALREVSMQISNAHELAHTFREMIEMRQPEKLDKWLQEAEKSQIVEFKRFADSLRSDYDAIKAALTYSWSNGQVEGQVNRLKTIKRQMYGRAKFGLLRKRVLGQAI
jgi:transposase